MIILSLNCYSLPDKQELYPEPDKDNGLGKTKPVFELKVKHLQPEPEKLSENRSQSKLTWKKIESC